MGEGKILDTMINTLPASAAYALPGLIFRKENDYTRFMRIAASAFGVMPGDLRSRSRLLPIVLARHCYAYLCRNRISPAPAYRAIGTTIERDHATILHSCKIVNDMLSLKRCPKAVKELCS